MLSVFFSSMHKPGFTWQRIQSQCKTIGARLSNVHAGPQQAVGNLIR